MTEINHCSNTENDGKDLAVVTQIVSDRITVERLVLGSCGSCSLHGVCGAKNHPKMTFTQKGDFKIGDKVEIIASAKSKIFSAFFIFMFPIVMLIIFYLIAFFLIDLNEGSAILTGFLGLIFSLPIVKLIDKKFAKHNSVTLKKIYGEYNEN